MKGFLKETITPADVERLNAKFRAWDTVIAEGWLNDPESDKYYETISLLRDPSIYAYAFFKAPDGSRFKVYPYQDLFMNDLHPRIIFCAANQIGKSMSLRLKAVHFALLHPGTTTLLISKTFPQSKDLLRGIVELLRSSDIDYSNSIGESETKTEVYFRHYDSLGKKLPDSRIICVPATEAALGYPADLLLIDELAFFQDGHYFYYQIAQPRTYATKGQICIISNPNGRQGIFWELWNDPDFHRYRFNYLDKPGNTREEYEKLREKMSRAEFDSTVRAVFTSAEGGFLTVGEIKDMEEDRISHIPLSTPPLYIFLDLAKIRDRTVRVIGSPVPIDGKPDKNMVYVYDMKQYPAGTDYTEIVEDLQSLIDQVGWERIAQIGFDATGVGEGFKDMLKKAKIQATPVDFNINNKSRIYTIFKMLVEERRLKIPYDPDCHFQLGQLMFKKTSSGKLMVHHERETDRDDFPDALAGLCSMIEVPDSPPVTLEIV